jgi:ATP-binding cassette, subfamily B, bacterial
MTDRPPAMKTSTALRRAFRVAPALRKGLLVTLALAVAGTALQIVVPVTIQRLIDTQILSSSGVDARAVIVGGSIALIAVIAAAVARRLSLVRLARSSATGLADLRVEAFSHIHRLASLHVQSERRGALVSRVTSDIETMQTFMEWGGVGMILGSAQVTLAVIVMLVYQWQLALFVVTGVFVYALILLGSQRILRRAHDRVRERVSDSLAAMGEAISGLETVRAYGMEGVVMGRVNGSLDRQFRAEFRTHTLGAALFSSAEVFAGLITAMVVAVGVVFGAEWGMTAGTLVAFLFLVNLLVEPIQMLVETIDMAQSAGAGLRKVLGVLDTPIDVPDPEDGVDLPQDGLGVSFHRVRFRYPTGDDVLRDITVDIAPGAMVAIVGETGSGKTTFAKLVTRLLDPTAGTVSIGGISVDRVRFTSLRRRVAYVPQDGFLFDMSIADNVRYGKPGVDDLGITAAFADLGISDWISSLSDGLRTRVGERGSNLSAGERQLVALVRAWIADPDVLVLDEATSAVDPALEVQLRRAIERLLQGRTSITVAHRLSTAEAADEILVFDDGELVERGRHADLVASDGIYSDLHRDWEGATSAI